MSSTEPVRLQVPEHLQELANSVVSRSTSIYSIPNTNGYVGHIPVEPPVAVEQLTKTLQDYLIGGENGVDWGRIVVKEGDKRRVVGTQALDKTRFLPGAVVVAVQPQIYTPSKGVVVRDGSNKIIGWREGGFDFVASSGKFAGTYNPN